MRGTRLGIALVFVMVSGYAHAFHAGRTFNDPPGGGGGGGLFYTGSPRERGWDCTTCHVDPPGNLRVSVASDPAELFGEGSYVPDRAYRIIVQMLNPESQLGLGATRSNFNSIAATFVDADGNVTGNLMFDATRYFARGSAILASNSTQPNETQWDFTFTAPPAGTGPVTMYLGVVDGDGAGSDATTTLNDPFGDDVAMGVFTFAEQ